MKKIFLSIVIILLLFVNISVKADYDVVTYVQTPNGTNVLVLTNREPMDDDTTSSIYEMIKEDYPEATYLAPATYDYNCHSYAWYLNDPFWNLYWMPDPSSYINDKSYCEVITPNVGDVIVYYDDLGNIIHSGIVDSLNNINSNDVCGNSNTVNVKSKWGSYGLYLHRGDQCPYTAYNNFSSPTSTYIKYYRLHALLLDCIYFNGSSHRFSCDCGYSYTSPHIALYDDINDGDNKALCLECDSILNLNYDIVMSRNINDNYFTLSNGIIVLVNYSIEDYYKESRM